MGLIPTKFWELLKAFIETKRCGKFTLHVKDGKVLTIDIQESVTL